MFYLRKNGYIKTTNKKVKFLFLNSHSTSLTTNTTVVKTSENKTKRHESSKCIIILATMYKTRINYNHNKKNYLVS